MANQYGLPQKQPMTPGTPRVSPSAAVAHQLLDQPVAVLVHTYAPQYDSKVPPDKANKTFREVMKNSDFMTKAFIMSVVGQHLPKGVTAEDIGKAVNEAPPPPPEAPAAKTPASEAPAAAPAVGSTSQPAVQAGAGPAAVAAAREADTSPRSGGGGGGGSDHYRKMREPFAAELKDPGTRRLLRGIISAENPGAGSAVAESLMNRTAMVNEQRAAKGQPPLTLKAMIQGDASIGGGQSFYGPVRSGAINQHLARVDADKNYAAQLDSHITKALGGADTIKGHTDQGSKGDPNYDAGGIGVNINGERFNDWGYGGSREWREKNQALASSGGTSGPVPLDPTPNVGSGQSDYDRPATPMVDPTPNVASGASDYAPADTRVATADAADTVSGKPHNYGKDIGDAFSGFADILAKGPVAQNAARASSPANVPGSGVMPIPQGPVPMVDPRVADAQRQQLAMALQRLNSRKLV